MARTVHGGRPVLIEYALTESGMALGKAIDALAEWAERFATAEAPAEAVVSEPTSVVP